MAATSLAAIQYFGRDFAFPNHIEGLPANLSDVRGLTINTFRTSDGVKMAYWKIGSGEPLVFLPGWSAHGAMYINLLFLLGQSYQVIVLDYRSHGLSQGVDYGTHIYRYSMDLKELLAHEGLSSAYFSGWSMGCSVLWGFIDLFGTDMIKKVAFVDEAPSIYNHAQWLEEERANAGAFVSSIERGVAFFDGSVPINRGIVNTDVSKYFNPNDTEAFQNSQAFVTEFIKPDMDHMKLVLFDHLSNDWRDVIRTKIDIPTMIFTGVHSDWLLSQRWIHNVVHGSRLDVYSAAEWGDHFLIFKNPSKFSRDLREFLG